MPTMTSDLLLPKDGTCVIPADPVFPKRPKSSQREQTWERIQKQTLEKMCENEPSSVNSARTLELPAPPRGTKKHAPDH